MKTIKLWSEIPQAVREELEEQLAEDILERYNNEEYHDKELIREVLAEHGLRFEEPI